MLTSTTTNSDKILSLIEVAFSFIYYFHIRYIKENIITKSDSIKQKFWVGIQMI